jgi:hypothetical protein
LVFILDGNYQKSQIKERIFNFTMAAILKNKKYEGKAIRVNKEGTYA